MRVDLPEPLTPVNPELDALFAEQYHLTTEAVNETVTETATVRVGESLGQVVTSEMCIRDSCQLSLR